MVRMSDLPRVAAARATASHQAPTPALHDRAIQDLSFIRRTIEGAASFTDVPGWGLVGVGAVALMAAPVAYAQPTDRRWMAVWIGTALVAGLIGAATMWRKMRRRVAASGADVLSVPARRFLLGFWPAIAAGAVLTIALVDVTTPGIGGHVTHRIMPGLWLLLYGVGITTAGAHSVRAVPLLGLAFMTLGVVALLCPDAPGDVMMALGFGVLQGAFGVYIARRYDG